METYQILFNGTLAKTEKRNGHLSCNQREPSLLILTFLDAFQRPYGNGEEWPTVIWVEGVGSGAGPFSPWMPLPAEGSIYLKCGDGFFFCGYSDFYENDGTEEVRDTKQYLNGGNRPMTFWADA